MNIGWHSDWALDISAVAATERQEKLSICKLVCVCMPVGVCSIASPWHDQCSGWPPSCSVHHVLWMRAKPSLANPRGILVDCSLALLACSKSSKHEIQSFIYTHYWTSCIFKVLGTYLHSMQLLFCLPAPQAARALESVTCDFISLSIWHEIQTLCRTPLCAH